MRSLGIVFLLLVALVACAPAGAAPPPTLDLDGLQAELAGGPVDGFMRTSMSGTAVDTIPVKVLAIVDGFYWGKLIMFESTAPAIVDNGGIAAGMSGSPLYVNVDGTDKIVGAVSYGDLFTLRGTGLATPIEYMTALQQRYASAASAAVNGSAVKLARPVATSGGVVRELVLAAGEDAHPAASDGTAVMRPLAVARITGLASGSAAYRKVAARLETSGLTVLPGDRAGAGVATPSLEAGSPCGVVFSTGGYALSVLGTVTYVDDETALLFGHPILGGYSGLDLGLGPIEGTLTGATVDAIWPSTLSPYKMMTPQDAKGTATQDRAPGVVARLSGSAATFPVATHASVDGGATIDVHTDLSHWFATRYYPEMADDWGDSPGATTFIAAAGLYRALDSDPLVGSATTTTTVVASDGVEDYTITRDNLWDNNGDETWSGLADAAVGDVTRILAAVLSDPYGVHDVEIKSVDVDADFASARRYAGITDATIARAIRAGANDVSVTYYRTGSAEPQSLHATLDVPAGTDLSGYLRVMSATRYSDYYEDYYYGSASPPMTLAETKELIDSEPTNSDVIVAFVSNSSDEDDYYYDEPEPAAETTVRGDWVFKSGVEKSTAGVVARARRTADLGVPIRLTGYIRRTSDDVPVRIYCQEAGDPEPLEPTVTVTAEGDDGTASFVATLPGFKHNVLLTAEVDALTATTLPGADQLTVKVRAATRLAAVRRGGRLVLTARVSPRDATGKVVFHKQVRGRWVTAAAVVLSDGSARVTMSGRGVTKVRARFAGGDTNAAGAWATRTVK
jgi:hypothetical protein